MKAWWAANRIGGTRVCQPVVVNQWASWCEPCRAEFPFFQASAEAHAADIAFVGIDMQDEPSAAEAFLAELPVPYPSISDPDAAQIRSLGGGVVSPTTVFIDEQGEVVAVFQGYLHVRGAARGGHRAEPAERTGIAKGELSPCRRSAESD